MISNGDGNENHQEQRTHENALDQETNEFHVVLIAIKIIILAIILVPLAEYSIRIRHDTNQTEIDQIQNLTIENAIQVSMENLTNTKLEVIQETEVTEVKIPLIQESCPKSDMLVILEEICEELIQRSNTCTPKDFENINKHKIPKRVLKNRRKKEAKVPAIINYAVGIILLTSLGAALLELYKAKKNPEKKGGKHPLSRKCSLADLTVMKHHRKEMVRRESLWEVPEESLYSKQMVSKPAPLHRQCSFPVGPSSISSPRRRLSIQANRFVPVVDGRPAAVLEGGRRHSIISDGRQPLILESRGISVGDGRGMILDMAALDDSPERRYRGRLVHRH